MANQNEKFSRIIEYKGTFDISAILASFNKLKSSLKQRGVSDADILNLDQEIKKVAELEKAVQKAMQKGFKSPKEFSDFTNLTSQASKAMDKLSQNFRRIDANTLADQMKQVSNNAKLLQQTTERISNAYLKNLNSVLKESQNRDEINRKIKENLSNISKGVDAEYKIKNILQDELTVQENNLNKSREELVTREQTLETIKKQGEELQKLNNFSVTKDGKNFRSNFLQTGNYTTLNGEGITSAQMGDVQSALTQVMGNSKSSIKQLEKVLEEYGLKLKNAEEKTLLFNEAARQFKERVTAQKDAIKQAQAAIKEQTEAVENLESSHNKLKSGFGTGENAGQGSLVMDYEEIAKKSTQLYALQQQELELQRQQSAPLPGLQQNLDLQNRFNESLERNIEETQQSINAQKTLDSTFDQLSNRLKYMLSFMNTWHVSMRAIRQTFNDIQKIDKAFASIAMVTDYDISGLWEQYADYAKIANELGQSTESVIQSSALYYQQGLQTQEVLSLTKDTMKLATLANIDFSESTKLMTSALRSFHMEMEEGAHITDVYSELAAHAAADVQGIAYAMSKTASIAASAGMDFENLAAMLTTMIEVTQEAPRNLKAA